MSTEAKITEARNHLASATVALNAALEGKWPNMAAVLEPDNYECPMMTGIMCDDAPDFPAQPCAECECKRKSIAYHSAADGGAG